MEVTPNIIADNEHLPLPAPETVPENSKTAKVDDLNGQFAPQGGNIQPTVVGFPEPVQVDIHHPADTDEDRTLTVITDDWANVAASVAKQVLYGSDTSKGLANSPTPITAPDTTPEVEYVHSDTTVTALPSTVTVVVSDEGEASETVETPSDDSSSLPKTRRNRSKV